MVVRQQRSTERRRLTNSHVKLVSRSGRHTDEFTPKRDCVLGGVVARRNEGGLGRPSAGKNSALTTKRPPASRITNESDLRRGGNLLPHLHLGAITLEQFAHPLRTAPVDL